jgi:carboxymethylenebutenolidase
MAFERYLAEEVAIDHADGVLSRREALRRLALLGLGLPSASALLAACGGDDGGTAPGPGGPATGPTAAPGPDPVDTEAISFDGPEGRTLQAAWAAAGQPRGAVLVVHENRGLNDHIRSVAGRLAASGYSALAIDLLSAEGGTAALGDEASAMAALSAAPQERFVADMRAGLGELERRAPGAELGAIGFCFGGGMVWLLLASGEPRLAAAAPFYGPLPDGADFSGSSAAVLGVYAENDGRVNASRGAATAALEQAGLTHEIVTYPGADHAFFNDTGPRYDRAAATQAWDKVLDWFGRHLG